MSKAYGIKDKVAELVKNRRRVLAPFPVDPKAIWELIYKPDELAAIQLLHERHPKILERCTAFGITNLEGGRRVSLKLRAPGTYLNAAIDASVLPGEIRASIEVWAEQWVARNKEGHAAENKVQQLVDQCRNDGQIVRVWPELETLFTHEERAGLHQRKSVASWPKGLDEDLFSKEALAPLSLLIAECMMLPEKKEEHATVDHWL